MGLHTPVDGARLQARGVIQATVPLLNDPKKLSVAGEYVNVWYVGQPMQCAHCGEEHKAEDCQNVICYNCNETGHTSNQCKNERVCKKCKKPGHDKEECGKVELNENKQCEESDWDFESISDLDLEDEGDSPKYSPIEDSENIEEEWTEDEVIEACSSENTNVGKLFTKKRITEMWRKVEKKMTEEEKKEGLRITESISARQAVEIFLRYKQEQEEIQASTTIHENDKTKLIKKQQPWLYGTLNTIRKENVAGIYSEKLVKFKTNINGDRKRNSEEISPQSSYRRNKNSRSD